MSSDSRSLSLRAPSNELTRNTLDISQGILLDGTVNPDVVDIVPDLMEASSEPQNPEPQATLLPWYKRPSAAWLLYGTFIGAIAVSATVAPRVEIFIKLACQEIRPEYSSLGRGAGEVIDWPSHIGAVVIPRPSAKCQADPEVQQAVAEIGAMITTTMGTLSCLTAGWWGKFCDRYGRVKVLALTTLGVLLADFTFIAVAVAHEKLPGGYRFLLVAPIVEGLLGGTASGSVAAHAYLSDITTPASRSRTFSLMLGLLFCGVAIGPTIGGLLISSTDNILSVFYVAAALHATYALLMLFVIPESLTKEMANANSEQAKQRAEHAREVREAENGKPVTLSQRVGRILGFIFFFMKPLAIILPHRIKGTRRHDWNLTMLAMSFGMMTLLMGSYQFKFQYATYAYGWTSQQLGYWLSTIGVVRALYLIVILPTAIKFFHPDARSNRESRGASINNPSQSSRPRGLPHDPAFDLAIARVSLLLELCHYFIATIATNVTIWISATVIGSFGGGFSPSLQALATELFNHRETAIHGDERAGENYGQLFGALGVIQAFCSQMLGPVLFGAVFVNTIEVYPKGIFVTSGITVVAGLIFLSLVRVSRREAVDAEREPLLSNGGDRIVIHED